MLRQRVRRQPWNRQRLSMCRASVELHHGVTVWGVCSGLEGIGWGVTRGGKWAWHAAVSRFLRVELPLEAGGKRCAVVDDAVNSGLLPLCGAYQPIGVRSQQTRPKLCIRCGVRSRRQ